MRSIDKESERLLQQARQRGARATDGIALPAELDKFTVYVGLLDRALELGKLMQTEERDLKVIEAHYAIEMGRIGTAFKKIELGMSADFKRDKSLRAKTFEAINLLIQAGNHEVALKFYERMLEGFTRGALDSLILLRNAETEATGTRIVRK